jgi:hypothetical protein
MQNLCKINDFIGIWDNCLPSVACNDLISNFESLINSNRSILIEGKNKFDNGSLGRNDFAITLNYHHPNADEIYKFLSVCLNEYLEEYSQLNGNDLIASQIKMQKTPPGGGYHVWHYENENWEVSDRELAWMIYLNDLPEGQAETEFLYQKTRVHPKQGRVVIWPAGFTHVHRGNTVFTEDKYILTGWYIRAPR